LFDYKEILKAEERFFPTVSKNQKKADQKRKNNFRHRLIKKRQQKTLVFKIGELGIEKL